MIKKRDPIAIASVGVFLENSLEELKVLKLNLENHIKEINNYYEGNDAREIVSHFFNDTSKMNSVFTNIDNYSKYLKFLSGYDRDNLKFSSEKLKKVMNDTLNFNNTIPCDDLLIIEGVDESV